MTKGKDLSGTRQLSIFHQMCLQSAASAVAPLATELTQPSWNYAHAPMVSALPP